MEFIKLNLSVIKEIEAFDTDDYENQKSELIQQLEEQGFDVTILSESDGTDPDDDDFDFDDEEEDYKNNKSFFDDEEKDESY